MKLFESNSLLLTAQSSLAQTLTQVALISGRRELLVDLGPSVALTDAPSEPSRDP
jgi:hypothetical protein